jgi:hypothetical protein
LVGCFQSLLQMPGTGLSFFCSHFPVVLILQFVPVCVGISLYCSHCQAVPGLQFVSFFTCLSLSCSHCQASLSFFCGFYLAAPDWQSVRTWVGWSHFNLQQLPGSSDCLSLLCSRCLASMNFGARLVVPGLAGQQFLLQPMSGRPEVQIQADSYLGWLADSFFCSRCLASLNFGAR